MSAGNSHIAYFMIKAVIWGNDGVIPFDSLGGIIYLIIKILGTLSPAKRREIIGIAVIRIPRARGWGKVC
jgi:hypothetical protein